MALSDKMYEIKNGYGRIDRKMPPRDPLNSHNQYDEYYGSATPADFSDIERATQPGTGVKK